MTENVPPTPLDSSTMPAPANPTATPNAPPSTARGLPYYESLRRNLRDSLAKKRTLEKSLAQLEENLYRTETQYLEDTGAAGNIVRGFDGYIKAGITATNTGTVPGSATGGAGSGAGSAVMGGGVGTISGSALGGAAAGRQGRKHAVLDNERVFSRSSVSFRGEDGNGNGSVKGEGVSGTNTPVGSGTPVADGPARDRKKKKIAKEEDADVNGTVQEGRIKRNKISFTSRARHHDGD